MLALENSRDFSRRCAEVQGCKIRADAHAHAHVRAHMHAHAWAVSSNALDHPPTGAQRCSSDFAILFGTPSGGVASGEQCLAGICSTYLVRLQRSAGDGPPHMCPRHPASGTTMVQESIACPWSPRQVAGVQEGIQLRSEPKRSKPMAEGATVGREGGFGKSRIFGTSLL